MSAGAAPDCGLSGWADAAVRWHPLWAAPLERGAELGVSGSADAATVCAARGADVVILSGSSGALQGRAAGAAGVGVRALALSPDGTGLLVLGAAGAALWREEPPGSGEWRELPRPAPAAQRACCGCWLPPAAAAPLGGAAVVGTAAGEVTALDASAGLADLGGGSGWSWRGPLREAAVTALTAAPQGCTLGAELRPRDEDGDDNGDPSSVWTLDIATETWQPLPGPLEAPISLGHVSGPEGRELLCAAAERGGGVQVLRRPAPGAHWLAHWRAPLPAPAACCLAGDGELHLLLPAGGGAPVLLQWQLHGGLPTSTSAGAPQAALRGARCAKPPQGTRHLGAAWRCWLPPCGKGALLRTPDGLVAYCPTPPASSVGLGGPAGDESEGAARRIGRAQRLSRLRESLRAERRMLLSAGLNAEQAWEAAQVAQSAVRGWLARRAVARLPREEIVAAGGRAEWELLHGELRRQRAGLRRALRGGRLELAAAERAARVELLRRGQHRGSGSLLLSPPAAAAAGCLAALASAAVRAADEALRVIDSYPEWQQAVWRTHSGRIERLARTEGLERGTVQRQHTEGLRRARRRHEREHGIVSAMIHTRLMGHDPSRVVEPPPEPPPDLQPAEWRPTPRPKTQPAEQNRLVAGALQRIEEDRQRAAAARAPGAAPVPQGALRPGAGGMLRRPSSAPLAQRRGGGSGGALAGGAGADVPGSDGPPPCMPPRPATAGQRRAEQSAMEDACLGDIPDRLRRGDPLLLELDLRWRLPGDGAVSKIAAALAFNNLLLELLLDDNPIGDASALALAAALRRNTALRRLSLKRTRVSGAGVRLLLAALRENSSIQDICVSGCDVDWTAATALAAALAGRRPGAPPPPRMRDYPAAPWKHARLSLQQPRCESREGAALRRRRLLGRHLPCGTATEGTSSDGVDTGDSAPYAAELAIAAKDRRAARRAARALVTTEAWQHRPDEAPRAAADPAWLRRLGWGKPIDISCY